MIYAESKVGMRVRCTTTGACGYIIKNHTVDKSGCVVKFDNEGYTFIEFEYLTIE